MTVKQFRYANCVTDGVIGSSTVKSCYKKFYVFTALQNYLLITVFKMNLYYKFCNILDTILQNASTACLGLP